jgi:hypothetical protein
MTITIAGMEDKIAREFVTWLKRMWIKPQIDVGEFGWNISFVATKETKIEFDEDCISVNTKYESIDIEKADFVTVEIQ